jgi:hypothetical protein
MMVKMSPRREVEVVHQYEAAKGHGQVFDDYVWLTLFPGQKICCHNPIPQRH